MQKESTRIEQFVQLGTELQQWQKTRHKRHKDQLPCDTVYTSHNVNEMSTVHTCITFDDMQWSRQWSRNSHDINYEDLKMKEVCVHWILTQCSNTNRVDTFCQVPAIHNLHELNTTKLCTTQIKMFKILSSLWYIMKLLFMSWKNFLAYPLVIKTFILYRHPRVVLHVKKSDIIQRSIC